MVILRVSFLNTGGHNDRYPDERGVFFHSVYDHNSYNMNGRKSLRDCAHEHKRTLPITRSPEYFAKTLEFVKSIV